MRRTALFLSVAIVSVIAGCGKDNTSAESVLYGMWSKGTGFGDTLWFYNQNGKHMMRQSMSFNPLLPVYDTCQYKFLNNTLVQVRTFNGVTIERNIAFTWKDYPSVFEINGPDIYLFSATVVGPYFSFKKIQ